MLVEFHVIFIIRQEIEEIFFGFEILGRFEFVRGFRGKETVNDLSDSPPIFACC
jgi:hypothetical protein